MTESDPLDDLQSSAGNSFVRVVLEVIGNMRNGFQNLLETSRNLRPETVIEVSSRITGILDQYYKMINHRHSVEGIKIHLDPITTDIALSIYQNVDSHGEIQDGKNPDEISAYTMRKAILLAESSNSTVRSPK
jgi:hypothetical protein